MFWPIIIPPLIYVLSSAIFDLIAIFVPETRIQHSTVPDRTKTYILSVVNMTVGTISMHYMLPFITSPGTTSIYTLIKGPIALFLTDTFFYWSHRFMHIPFVYKFIHKFHHYHKSPIGATALYVHPGEAVLAFFCIFLLPVYITNLTKYEAIYIWSLIMWALVSSHSGLKGISDQHDKHHEYGFNKAYGSEWGLWDRLCGTA